MDDIINNRLSIKSLGLPTRINLVQYTNAMQLAFTFGDYSIPEGATARIYVRKPSGKEVYNDASISGDTVTVKTTTQMTAEAGENSAQLEIIRGQTVAASFRFHLFVQKNIAADSAVESADEYGVLDNIIRDANDILDNVTNAENVRVQAEKKRQQDTAMAIENLNTARDNAVRATEKADAVVSEIQEKLDKGQLIGPKGDVGPQGLQGPKGDKGDTGKDGNAVAASLPAGYFGMSVDGRGHLIMTHNDNEPAPPLSIQNGRMVYTIN